MSPVPAPDDHARSAAADAMSAAAQTLAVVIPNFNYARYLPQAIESVLSQVPAFDEIVVVDDGSTDDSLEVLARYDGRLTVLALANCGQLGACRAGLAATTADYVYSLDADDYAAPGLVARVRAALASRPAKVQFQLRGVGDAGADLGSTFPTFPSGYDAAAMRWDNAALGFYICPPTSGNVFSREALARLDLEALDPRGAFDGSPALAIPYLGAVVSIPEPLAFYRVHGGSMSRWGEPTPDLLQREIRLFHVSWDEVAAALGPSIRSPHGAPLYVREREMMMACLQGRWVVASLVRRFIAGLLRTHLPAKQKIVFAIWATVLLVPSAGLRSYCIRMKRSSVNRSRSLRTILNAVMGSRTTASPRASPGANPGATPG